MTASASIADTANRILGEARRAGRFQARDCAAHTVRGVPVLAVDAGAYNAAVEILAGHGIEARWLDYGSGYLHAAILRPAR